MSDRPVPPASSRPVRPTNRATATARRSPVSPAPPTTPSPRRSSHRRTAPPPIDIRQLATSMLVALLVIATLWAERGLPDAVAGYGVLDARGVAVSTQAEGIAVGQPAPDFRLQDTDGTAISLSDQAGTPVVLQFWTSWCLDCIDAIPIFQQVAANHPNDAVVLGIAPDEKASRIEGALDRAGATYLTLLDTESVVTNRYGATTLPFTVVIDANGTIVAIHEGRVSAAQLESDLSSLLP